MRLSPSPSLPLSMAFQSTHPRGVRQDYYRLVAIYPFISIHAPARGATTRYIQSPHSLCIFQSTHPRGVRQIYIDSDVLTETFQSTHPRGVRLFVGLIYCKIGFISIHAPARGATWILFSPPIPRFIFQSTHPRGVRRLLCPIYF